MPAEKHPAVTAARHWTLAVGIALSLCLFAAAFQTGFLAFAARALKPAHRLATKPPVVWTLSQGGLSHVARQVNRSADGRTVVLSSGVAFEAFSGAIRAAPAPLLLDPAGRVNASATSG